MKLACSAGLFLLSSSLSLSLSLSPLPLNIAIVYELNRMSVCVCVCVCVCLLRMTQALIGILFTLYFCPSSSLTEARRKCDFFLRVFSLKWPKSSFMNCDKLPDSTDPEVCVGFREHQLLVMKSQGKFSLSLPSTFRSPSLSLLTCNH